MGIEEGKKVTRAIDDFFQKAKSGGYKIQTGNDHSQQLLVDRSTHSILGREIVSDLSPESQRLLREAIFASHGKLRVQAFRRPEVVSQQFGHAWLELSDPDSRTGLEVVINDADGRSPDVTTSLPRTYYIGSGKAVIDTADYLMKARSELTQIRDAEGVIATASLALGLEIAGRK